LQKGGWLQKWQDDSILCMLDFTVGGGEIDIFLCAHNSNSNGTDATGVGVVS